MPFLAAINAGFVTSRVVLPGTGASGGEGEGSGTPDTIDKATGGLGLTTNGATDSQWFEFNGDGTSLFVHNTGSGGLAPAGYLLNQFNLTTPYDLTTASYSNNVYYGSGNDFEGKFAGDGSKFYYDSGTLWQHNLSSAFVPGTDIRASGEADGSGPSGESFCFKNDGTKLYTLAKSNTPNGVIEYDLSTAWDITTNSLQGGGLAGNNFDYSGQMTGASNIEMNSTGTKFYIYTRNSTISGASIAIVEYDMTTPWDINSGTYNGKYLNVGADGFTSLERISFRLENDNKIFIKGQNSNHSGNDVIYQYTIPNASGSSDTLVENSTFVNAIASASDSNHTYSMASANISGDFADMKRIATNGTYTIVGDPNISVYHTGTGTTGTNQEVAQAGWIWIVRNSDGAIVKSCNSILNGDHDDSANIEQQTRGGVSSIGIEANIGYSVAINDNYAFTFAGFRLSGSGTSENFDDNRAYLFAYDLSDFSLAKVWKVNEFASTIDGYVGAPAYSSFTSGFGEHGMFATNDSLYIPSGYTAHTSNTNYPGGAVSYFDISDANPSNWTNPTVFKTPLTVNTTTNIGGSNYSNGNFGASGVYVYGTQVLVTHATRVHNYTRSGTSFSETSVYTPTYYIGENYNIPLSNGNVAMVTGDQTSKTLTVRDPANSWSQEWQVTLPGNGFPGYNVLIDAANDKLFTADSSHDGNGTDDGLITVYDADGTVNQTIQNPVSTNTRFGSGFSVHNGKLASKVRVGGVSTDLAIQFMDVPSYDPGGGDGGSSIDWGGDRGIVAGGFNLNNIEYFDITTPGNATDFGDMIQAGGIRTGLSSTSRGIFAGGNQSNLFNNSIEYITIATPGNGTDFGDLTINRYGSAGCSNGTIGIFAGAFNGAKQNSIDYITIATTGNAQDFGDLDDTTSHASAAGDATRGIIAGDETEGTGWEIMQYVTMASPGNAQSFGNLSVGRPYSTSASDSTRMLTLGGTSSNVIDYVTVQTPGNATDFGDLTSARRPTAGSNGTYAFAAGDSSGTIDYVTIQTPGNATDFGDLIAIDTYAASCAGSPGGGGSGGSSPAWGGDRGFTVGGDASGGSRTNSIEYIDISTPGNAQDFGDLLAGMASGTSGGNKTRGLTSRGTISGDSYNTDPSGWDVSIDYFTCATTGNASDFGDRTMRTSVSYCVADGTKVIWAGGQGGTASGPYNNGNNTIDYVTADTTGNATDFGDMTNAKHSGGYTNDDTRGVFISGLTASGYTNVIDYITMASTGNATDFGDLHQGSGAYAPSKGVISDNTTGVIAGGYDDTNYVARNYITKITIQTTGNSTDFGDLTTAHDNMLACSNGTTGLLIGGSTNASNEILQITIGTPGNATDFGDLVASTLYNGSGMSGSAS